MFCKKIFKIKIIKIKIIHGMTKHIYTLMST